MAAHVAERAGAEVEPFPPVSRMVIPLQERPLGRHAEPGVPVQVRRHRVGAVGPRVPVAPLFPAPAMNLAHLADRALLDGRHDRPVDRMGVDLDAHLGDQALLARHPGHLPGFVDGPRERLLGVDVQALLQRPHRDRGVHVVGRRDVDRVEVLFLVEQLAPVLVDMHVGEKLDQLCRAARSTSATATSLTCLLAVSDADVTQRHAAGAEAGVAECLARRGRGVGTEDERGEDSGGRKMFQSGTASHSRGRHRFGPVGGAEVVRRRSKTARAPAWQYRGARAGCQSTGSARCAPRSSIPDFASGIIS